MADPTGSSLLPTPGASWDIDVAADYVVYADGAPEADDEFRRSVAAGLSADPKWLHCRWLYDAQGSRLYEEITRQPEYYLTRAEDEILRRHAAAIRARVGDQTMVELGSGSSAKTRHLIDAWLDAGSARYVPVDISRSALEAACRELARAYPALHLEAIAASFSRALPLIRARSPLTLMFLGSTIGNLGDGELDDFLTLVMESLSPGDHFLLGIDLVKDGRVLEAAYDDAAGWTARFTTNIFARMNRELGTEIDVDAAEHVARYNDELERVEIYNRFRRPVEIDLGDAGCFRIAAGEEVFIEISRKFRIGDMVRRARQRGLVCDEVYTDDESRFAVLLLHRV